MNRPRRHSKQVVGDTSKRLALARGESFPKGGVSLAGVLRRPVHIVGGALIRTKKENFRTAIQIGDLVLDSRRLTRNQQVKNCVDIFVKRNLGAVLLVVVQ